MEHLQDHYIGLHRLISHGMKRIAKMDARAEAGGIRGGKGERWVSLGMHCMCWGRLVRGRNLDCCKAKWPSTA
jgi:hypothetical protein